MSPIQNRIRKLAQEKNALILAHYYVDGEIQDVADFVGDSYQLAKQGQQSKAEIIILCGVVFMAESVKAMNPEKRVFVPDMKAGCSLVKGSPAEEFKKWRQAQPNAVSVTYINSSLEVKALSDVIITSSNAEKIIQSIPKDRKILFAPDQHLGSYLQKKTGRNMELWKSSCEVHVLFSARRLHELKKAHPSALLLAHPECEEHVLAYADVIGSTSRLLQEVETNRACREFIIATEPGIVHQMRKARPDAEFFMGPTDDETCACNNCPYMKLNSLEKLEHTLTQLRDGEIFVEEELRQKALLPLERMMRITSGQTVEW